ncbi:hypothetical protein GGQ80_002968 [Sphingomonas jinjuensis]|uniref:Uncharacterized protein n=1 Tax=Sphingomonas jinjuensis TaxID=535907 RepID=A0A840FE14_9SPHN|nr:hypothetical protein [Sphingomonas jinjuensis]MBB4155051.1 hypothetical protein [Sphingomonas jinjuensis]
MQNDIAAAAAPLFHIDPPQIDPAKRKAELERIIEIATAALTKTQIRKLGGLSFAAARDDDDHSYFGQIRSEPIGASGVEYRFPVPARKTGDRDLVLVAAALVGGATHMARAERGLKKIGAGYRDLAEAAIEAGRGGIAEMRVVAIGATPGKTAEELKMTVDVEMLGDDLMPGIERVSEFADAHGLDRMEERLKGLAAKHVERRNVLARAKVLGSTGFIDDSALRVLDISGFGRAAALELLRSDRQVNFSFGGETGYDMTAGVYWNDGVVRGYVENRERGSTFRLEAMVLLLESNGLPDTIKAGLLGRHLGEAIDFRFIPGNALITGVEESGDWLYLTLEIGTSPIETAIGG